MSYATAIATSSTYRRLIKASGQIASLAYSKPTDPGDAIATAASLIQDIAHHQNNKSFITIADAATKAWDKIGEAHLNPNSIMGIPTGIAPLDTITHGLQDSDLIIIAGRPGVGKTAFAMTIVQHAVLKANVPTAVFSMEMSATQLATRMISSVASMDSQRIKTGDISSFEMERITRAVGTLHEAPLYIDDTAGLSTIDLRSRCKQMVLQHDIKLIVIDYLQLMYASTTKGGGHRTQEVAEISRTLKGIAREYNLPVIALSQLNRQIEMRPGKTPQLSDLRESGSIEQDADIVMFLSRDTLESEATDNDKLTELVIAKHRNGPVATIGLRFVKEQTTFVELT
jgi:replicative DNA helicase